jgi:hypothetical protein
LLRHSGSAYGGGIHSATGSVQMMNVTIASNTITPGALGTINNGGLALGSNVSSTNGTVTLRNSIFAYGGTNGNAWGAILDGGFNMSSDGSINLNSGSSFSFTDPKLGPLQDNGGPTPTMALLPGSPAIDFGERRRADDGSARISSAIRKRRGHWRIRSATERPGAECVSRLFKHLHDFLRCGSGTDVRNPLVVEFRFVAAGREHRPRDDEWSCDTHLQHVRPVPALLPIGAAVT